MGTCPDGMEADYCRARNFQECFAMFCYHDWQSTKCFEIHRFTAEIRTNSICPNKKITKPVSDRLCPIDHSASDLHRNEICFVGVGIFSPWVLLVRILRNSFLHWIVMVPTLTSIAELEPLRTLAIWEIWTSLRHSDCRKFSTPWHQDSFGFQTLQKPPGRNASWTCRRLYIASQTEFHLGLDPAPDSMSTTPSPEKDKGKCAPLTCRAFRVAAPKTHDWTSESIPTPSDNCHCTLRSIWHERHMFVLLVSEPNTDVHWASRDSECLGHLGSAILGYTWTVRQKNRLLKLIQSDPNVQDSCFKCQVLDFRHIG